MVLYLGSLGGLLVYSFWSLEEFTGLIDRTFTLSTYEALLSPANRDIMLRTLEHGERGDDRVRGPRVPARVLHGPVRDAADGKTCCISRVLMPLWSSYLVRVLSWRQILAREGVLYWALGKVGLDGVLDWFVRPRSSVGRR